MRIVYRDTALADLTEIEAYYSAISETSSLNVFNDIYATIEILKQFPKAGRQLEDGRRRFVSRKYRFIISHQTYVDRVEIIGVYRYQNR